VVVRQQAVGQCLVLVAALMVENARVRPVSGRGKNSKITDYIYIVFGKIKCVKKENGDGRRVQDLYSGFLFSIALARQLSTAANLSVSLSPLPPRDPSLVPAQPPRTASHFVKRFPTRLLKRQR